MASFFAVQQIPFFRLLLQPFLHWVSFSAPICCQFSGFFIYKLRCNYYQFPIRGMQLQNCLPGFAKPAFPSSWKVQPGFKKERWKVRANNERESEQWLLQTNKFSFLLPPKLTAFTSKHSYLQTNRFSAKNNCTICAKKREEGYCSWSWSWNRLKEVIVNVPSVNLTTSEENEKKTLRSRAWERADFKFIRRF